MYYYFAVIYKRARGLQRLPGGFSDYPSALAAGLKMAGDVSALVSTVSIMESDGRENTRIEVVTSQCFVVRVIK